MALVRVCALLLLLVSIEGCGGGAGNGASGANATSVTFTFSGNPPTAVAAKTGSGSFTQQTLTAGKLTLQLPSGTSNFALAYACPPPSTSDLTTIPITEEHILEATTSDGTAFSEICSAPAPTTGTTAMLTGSVDASAISSAAVVEVYAQSPQSGAIGFPHPILTTNGAFSFAVPAGTDRVMVLAYASVPTPGGGLLANATTNLVAARNFTAQAVPGALNGGNAVVLGTADQVSTEPITYSNVPDGYTSPATVVGFQSGTGGISVASAATSSYPVLPPAAVESGDSYFFLASSSSASNLSQRTIVRATLASAGPETISFPPAWPYAGPTPAALPSFNFSYGGFSSTAAVYAEAGVLWGIGFTSEYMVTVNASGSYLNGSTTVAIPDLSALTGFVAQPTSGTAVTWTSEMYQGSLSSTGPLTTVSNSGTYTVP